MNFKYFYIFSQIRVRYRLTQTCFHIGDWEPIMQLFCACCRSLDLQFLLQIMKLYSVFTYLPNNILEENNKYFQLLVNNITDSKTQF